MNKDIIIVGQGFAGLSAAIKLAERGARVQVVGPRSDPFMGSRAAHGACTIKGLLESSQELFALKMLGHRTLWPWILHLEKITGRVVPKIRGVFEQFASKEEAFTELSRIYKKKFRGAFAVTAKSLPFASEQKPWDHCFYTQDFWIDTDVLLEVMIAACDKLGVLFSSDLCVTRVLECGERVSAELIDGTTVGGSHIVLAAAVGIPKILEESHIPIPATLLGAPGCTYRGVLNVEQWSEDWCFVKELSAVAHYKNTLFIGSSTEVNGLSLQEQDLHSYLKKQGVRPKDDGFLQSALRRTIGLEKMPTDFLEERWGMRVRSKNRMPLIGLIDNTRRVYISSGYYKSGVSLAPVGASKLCEMIYSEGHRK